MIKDYDVYEPGRKERVGFSLCLLVVLCVASLLFYGSILGMGLLPMVYRPAERAYLKYRASLRKQRLLLQFRDFLYSLSASFATGRHMKEAMEEAQKNLAEIYGEGAELCEELAYMLIQMKDTGETDIQVLDSFSRRTGLDDVGDFTEVFRACRESGGDFITGVQRAAAVIGEKIAIEREIRTIISQKRLEGYIITAMPAVIILFLQLMSPDYLEVMYQTLAGRVLMTFALIVMTLAYMVIERITSIEI